MYEPAEAVLSFENHKEAALYFNRVIPVGLGPIMGQGDEKDVLIGYPERIPANALAHMLGRQPFTSLEDLTPIMFEWIRVAIRVQPVANVQNIDPTTRRDRDISKDLKTLQRAYAKNSKVLFKDGVRKVFQDYATALGVNSYSVILPNDTSFKQNHSDPCLTLAGLNLIDAHNASWEQILELRKDKTSQQQLKSLRLFMHENYAGKSRGFVEDDLGKRIFEYNRAVKNHGFETRNSSLSILLDSKALLGAGGTTLAAALIGFSGGGVRDLVSIAGSISGAGVAIEIAKIYLNISNKRHAMKDWKQSHDLAYLIEAQKISGQSKT